VHLLELAAAEYVPAAQSAQLEAPGAELKLPALQLEQVVEPVLFWKVPAAQPVHSLELPAEYFPAAHSEHVPLSVLNVPAPHSSAMHTLCPVSL